MSALDFLVILLATWRLAHLAVHEAGPAHIFKRLRLRFPQVDDGGAGELLHCMYCASVWTGALCMALWLAGLGVLLVPLAASGAALMLHQYSGMGLDV